MVDLRKPVALVVDDEAPVREIARRVLEAGGWTVFDAPGGMEALGVLEGGHHVDVLVTDVQMPEMSGTELASRVRASRRGIKILFLTGYADRLFTSGAVLPDDQAFLEKPFRAPELLEAASLLVFGSTRKP